MKRIPDKYWFGSKKLGPEGLSYTDGSICHEILGVEKAIHENYVMADSLNPDPETNKTEVVVVSAISGNMIHSLQMSMEVAAELLDLLDELLPE